ncbi:MAG: ATPase [Rhodobacterales bacterium]|nr:MAG: ATPase [Rhodobacterales bacterium]
MPGLKLPPPALKRLKWPLRLTRAGMAVERLAEAFWPFATAAMALGAVLMSGGPARWPDGLAAGSVAGLGLATLAGLVAGLRRYRPVTRQAALARLDASLRGRPIAALSDTQAVGRDDPASRAVWAAHRARAGAELDAARAVPPRPRLAAADPYALRLIAATALAAALLFGPGTERGDLARLVPGSAEAAVAGAAWEGWIEPPAYTGRPTLYLPDLPPGPLALPRGAQVTLRLYGRPGALRVEDSFSGDGPAEPEPTRVFRIEGDGSIAIGADRWEITAIPDTAPRIRAAGELTRRLDGEMRLPFAAEDDYGVVSGSAGIVLDLARVERRHGLAAEPEPRAAVVVDLPMPFRGDRAAIDEVLVENLAEHPWAGLPVEITFTAADAIGQEGASAPVEITLPGRRFLHPLARALVEQRRDILWSGANAPRAARLLRAIANRPADLFPDNGQYLALRAVIAGLEAEGFGTEQRDALAEALWALAVEIEDGRLADALEALRQARERLAEAMRQGASPEELQELMDAYRQAMRDYMDELASREPENRTDEPDRGEPTEMTQDDLQAMLDRIEELMQQGRTEEAQQLLDMLQQMMENMKVTEGDGRQGQGQGQRSLEELGETLREQQGLSDEAFRNLQNQRRDRPGKDRSGQDSRPDGQAEQPGEDGAPQGDPEDDPQGRPEGLPESAAEGRSGGAPEDGQGDDAGTGGEGARGEEGGENSRLADRQRALEERLRRQQQGLPGAATPEGEAARDALDRAGRAMDEAAEALDQGDTTGALDRQAEAMEALREGMRRIEEGMRRQAQAGEPGEGEQTAGPSGDSLRADPLGRTPGGAGSAGDDGPLADRDDVYRRAQDLMDELRRRSGETDRPELERDYLRRLLDLF